MTIDEKSLKKKECLKKYRELSLSIQIAEKEIDTLKREYLHYNNFISANKKNEDYKTCLSSLINHLKKLICKKSALTLDILQNIESLNNETEKNLLYLKYIDGYSWEKISEIMNYSLRQIYNLHNKALSHLREFYD